jgi:tryptophan synthase alpha chain
MGVTGARAAPSDLAAPLVERTRAVTDLPVGVGLGVSDGAQAAKVAAYADGVIVGSAFVRRVLDAEGDLDRACSDLRDLAQDLAAGVRRG